MKYLLPLLFIGLLSGCEQDDTPWKLMNCPANKSVSGECFVSARYRNLDSCEYSKKIGAMHCDSVSDPNKIVCENRGDSPIARTYCTK